MRERAPLILIDVQKGFFDPCWGPRNNPGAEKIIAQLLVEWRRRGWPVIHVQHLSVEPNSPLRPSLPGVAFMDEAMPLAGERVVQKNVNSAFIGTDLEKILKDQDFREIYCAGFTTDHCVSTSVRMAKNLGFSPTIIADATVAFERVDYRGRRFSADEVHAVSLASLGGEFAEIVESRELNPEAASQ